MSQLEDIFDDFINWLYGLFFKRESPEENAIVISIIDFLLDYGIDPGGMWRLDRQPEWTDYCFPVTNQQALERINTWLISDLKSYIKGGCTKEIFSPNPDTDKQHELKVRVYATKRPTEVVIENVS